MPVVEALCAGAQTVLPTEAPLGGALMEETALITRWLAAPGVRIVRAEPGYSSPVAAAGRHAAWSGSARSARLAAEQVTAQSAASAELPGEPHPTREQLLGRPGVDRLGRLSQTGLPGRHPLGVAG